MTQGRRSYWASTSAYDSVVTCIHMNFDGLKEYTKRCHVPNKEVADELLNAVEDTSWSRLADRENGQEIEVTSVLRP